MPDPIPVTLLTGFLGAGKTTILNRLLHDPLVGRVAVVVNEFGEAGLDHDLIERAAEDVVLMPGGCLCCSIRGDLSKALISLFARRARGELAFDRVIIETTGLADPGPIVHTLMADPALAPHYALDGIVTAVDSALGAGTLDRHVEARAQAAMADRIVLTKRDLADADSIHRLEARLDAINPSARRVEADRGRAPADALFGLGAMRRTMAPGDALDWLGAPGPDPLAGFSGLSSGKQESRFPAPSHHAIDDRIATASITVEEPIPAGVFDFWLDTMVALRGPDILRMKGIVHIVDVPRPFVFHGVQHLFDPPVPLEGWPEGDRASRVVVIARNISRADLQRSLSILRTRPHGGEMIWTMAAEVEETRF